MAPLQQEQESSFQVVNLGRTALVNLDRSEVVNLNRTRVVNENRTRVVNLTGFSSTVSLIKIYRKILTQTTWAFYCNRI
jgi:hypothetical protein